MESSPTPQLQAQADVVRLRDMIMGFRVTQMLYVAAKLQLADHLVDGPLSAERVAASAGADSASVGRLMRALTSLGILTEAGGRFGLTALGQLLRRDVPNSLNGIAMLYGEEWLWTAYGRMLHSVRTGETAFTQVHGMSLFEFLDRHPDAAAQFQAAMNVYPAWKPRRLRRHTRFPRTQPWSISEVARALCWPHYCPRIRR